MNTRKLNTEVLLWTALVLILSYLCYLPMFLEKKSIHISKVLLSSKYLFIIVPLLVSIFMMLKHGYLRKWFKALFVEKIKLQAIFSCIILGSIGLCFSIIYCLFVGKKDLFISSYPSVLAVVFNCSYLFVTALLEEMAWRGFLLNKLAAAKGKKIALVYVGIIWVIWHIPMWAVRNSLEFREILMYAIWTILISLILGILFYRYKNILIVSLSHMIFNTCFIAPVKYNVILLMCIIVSSFIIFNKKTIYGVQFS